jgi:hypothetical protein
MVRCVACAILAVCLASAPEAWAQARAGAEFRLNSYTTGIQNNAAVAAREDGSYVVLWRSGDVPDEVMQGQVLEPDGTPRGAEFTVAPLATGAQYRGEVAADARGNFVVAWDNGQGIYGPAASFDAFARRFAADGSPIGAPFLVDTYTTGYDTEVDVAVARDGAFVVVWTTTAPRDGDGYGVFGQSFDAAGQRRGGEFQVNATTTFHQIGPRVVAEPGGGYAVVWYSPDGAGFGIFMRRFDANGVSRGPERQISLAPGVTQDSADLVALPQGGFVVTWTSLGQDGSYTGVYGRRVDADGAAVGAEFRVNTTTTDWQHFPRVAVDSAGNFVVVWTSLAQDGSSGGVFGQRHDAAGVRRGGEFQVNTYTTAEQGLAMVGSDAAGNFLSVWQSEGQDGSGAGAFAQRYGGLRPASLAVEDGGNDVLEAPDDFVLATAWRNFSGAPQAIQGQASQVVVPAGLFLTLGPSADYGSIPDAAEGACIGPCFSGGLTGTRPAGHADITFRETLVPDAQGQVHTWRLHVGGSFTDVGSAGPFYRFVETLFHHGVTGGCTASTYCPMSITTRQEMAVFMLAAKEGAGYAPPACTAPPFPDVPAGSGFCPFIAELSRRGVVAGCGGGNYCPASPVLRQEMAVFALATLDPTFTPPPCTVPPFADVPTGNPFCPHIAELAARGVVSGCGGGSYCPAAAVTRQEMAVFISGTFGLLLYGP